MRAALPLLTRNPRGDIDSYSALPLQDTALINTLRVPTLVVQGGRDALFPPPLVRQQRNVYTEVRRLTTVTLPRSGHALSFEADHRALATTLDRFLDANRL